jgi:branched-chain amino acid transport system substrate-binding protein
MSRIVATQEQLETTMSVLLPRALLAAAFALAVVPAAADTLVIGQVAELSGQSVVAEQVAGAKLWFDSINESHGPHTFVLKQYDDRRDEKLTLPLTHKLIDEDNAIALFGYRSTPSLNALAGELDKLGIALVAPFNGSQTIRATARNAFFLRGSYRDEAMRLVAQLEAMGLRDAAVVYQDDPFGREGLAHYKEALAARGLASKMELPYDRKTLDVQPAIDALLHAQAQAVLMACTPKACADVIRKVRGAHNPMLFAVLSNAATDEFVKSVAPVGTNVIISQVMPYPWNTAYPLVRDFNRLNAAHHNGVTLSYSSLEGFAAARLLTEAVKAAGPKPTRAGIIEALRRMKGVDLGGIRYSAGEQHYFTEVTTVRSDGKIVH